MVEVLKRRFADLEVEADTIEATRRTGSGLNGRSVTNVSSERFLAWRVKVKSLITASCGPDSEHYKAFVEAEGYSSWSGNYGRFKHTKAVFSAAREDFDGGYITSIRNLIQAEVFDTELEQAKALLAAGYYQAAAIIAGVVLETNLRELCVQEQIACGKLDRMNADLAKAGKYNSIIQKRVTSLAAIRNSAAHGDLQNFSRVDVTTMIEEIERLVGSWLS